MGSGSSKSKFFSGKDAYPAIDEGTEDALEALKRFDIIIVVDDSASMRGDRWKQAGKALATLAAVAAKYDADGIEIQFLNSSESRSGVTDPREVKKLFKSVSPSGATPLGWKIGSILDQYELQWSRDPTTKPVNLVVITDGAPTDGRATEDAILKTAKSLDKKNARVAQLGVQFVQIGDDPNATAYLQKLDDELGKNGVRDIVDTTLPEGKELDLVKILIGAVNRRVDNKGSAVLRPAI